MQTKLFPIAIALCFFSASLRADVPAGNFWTNPTFESGTDLNLATGTPDNWNRGGADGSILQVSTANSVSASHSLAVIKPVAGPYGEWYSDVPIFGIAGFGDTVNLHWHEIYSIGGFAPGNPNDVGKMRVTVRFLDGFNNGPDNHMEVSGNSAGWVSTLADSSFSVRNVSLLVNQPDAVVMRIQLVSGGGDFTTGSYIIDDLSVSVVAVPEPSSIAMLGLGGLVGLNAIRRRRLAC
jgi:hypothetical protein